MNQSILLPKHLQGQILNDDSIITSKKEQEREAAILGKVIRKREEMHRAELQELKDRFTELEYQLKQRIKDD